MAETKNSRLLHIAKQSYLNTDRILYVVPFKKDQDRLRKERSDIRIHDFSEGKTISIIYMLDGSAYFSSFNTGTLCGKNEKFFQFSQNCYVKKEEVEYIASYPRAKKELLRIAKQENVLGNWSLRRYRGHDPQQSVVALTNEIFLITNITVDKLKAGFEAGQKPKREGE